MNSNSDLYTTDKSSKNESENKSKDDKPSPWINNDMYPERRSGGTQRNWLKVFFGMEGKEELQKMKCERNVYWCFRNSLLVKILIGALNNSGCKFDIRRHISCEQCHSTVSGGYDPEYNQVIICQNVAKSKSIVQGVLTHELIHMFDYCRNELDLNNIDHLACSEIRAANLAHCSFLSAWWYGSASPFNIKGRHKECVRRKALSSVMAMKNCSEKEGLEAIDRVFPKCYNDLEPIGRRCKRKSIDPELAYAEAPLYGYEYKL